MTWTEHGGALLVDGLVVQPSVRVAVLSSDDAGLRGVVVNLTGLYTPTQLSADRVQVLDDVSPTAGRTVLASLDTVAPGSLAALAGSLDPTMPGPDRAQDAVTGMQGLIPRIRDGSCG
ncbi:hypothetical protein ACFVUY_29100 [Kitasatospora sp. NPDC058063]|uniref:hypothetical protein n=1 Tax=unclassified Kitasatospora TaxID=2633591 RepID=UPI0036DEF83A